MRALARTTFSCPSLLADRLSSPTARFSVRADFYSKYRPGYPKGLVEALQKETGFSSRHIVADIGSGTGLLSRAFLENGNMVLGVEPNARMRRYAEANLRLFPNFVSVNGTAEESTLPANSVDLVAVGQALHWFDPSDAVREFSRISKPAGRLCVAYNENRRGSGFMDAFQKVTDRNESRRRRVPDVDSRYASRFFENGRFSESILKNEQRLDYEGLVGRLLSASHMPAPREQSRVRKLRRDVRSLFDAYQSEGTVRLLYDTRLFIGRVSRG